MPCKSCLVYQLKKVAATCVHTCTICPNQCCFALAFHQSNLQRSSAPGLPCSSPQMQSQRKPKENEAAESRITEPAGVLLSPWFCKEPAKKQSQGFYTSTRSLALFFVVGGGVFFDCFCCCLRSSAVFSRGRFKIFYR